MHPNFRRQLFRNSEKNKNYLSDCSTTFADDIFMKLFEDVYFSHIVLGNKFLVHLLQISKAFVNIALGSSQSYNFRLLVSIRECDLQLIESVADFLNLSSLGSDNGLVESLLNDDVSRLLVFL